MSNHSGSSGEERPTRGDMRSERLVGLPSMTVEERFHSLMAKKPCEFVIVTDFSEFAEQSGLTEFLRDGSPMLVDRESYRILDLR